MSKKCTKCGLEKDIEEFRFRDKAKGIRQTWCKSCFSDFEKKTWKESEKRRKSNMARNRERNIRNAQFVWDFLKTHPCVICGENDPIVLEFDHIDADNKEIEVGGLVRRSCSIERIKEEIEKCQVLCSNCHARKTAKQFNYYKDIIK